MGLNEEFYSDLLPLIWNSLYLIISQATNMELEWSQLKCKRECEKEGHKH